MKWITYYSEAANWLDILDGPLEPEEAKIKLRQHAAKIVIDTLSVDKAEAEKILKEAEEDEQCDQVNRMTTISISDTAFFMNYGGLTERLQITEYDPMGAFVSSEAIQKMFEHYVSRLQYKRYTAAHGSQDESWAMGEVSEAEKWLKLVGLDPAKISYFEREALIAGEKPVDVNMIKKNHGGE